MNRYRKKQIVYYCIEAFKCFVVGFWVGDFQNCAKSIKPSCKWVLLDTTKVLNTTAQIDELLLDQFELWFISFKLWMALCTIGALHDRCVARSYLKSSNFSRMRTKYIFMKLWWFEIWIDFWFRIWQTQVEDRRKMWNGKHMFNFTHRYESLENVSNIKHFVRDVSLLARKYDFGNKNITNFKFGTLSWIQFTHKTLLMIKPHTISNSSLHFFWLQKPFCSDPTANNRYQNLAAVAQWHRSITFD